MISYHTIELQLHLFKSADAVKIKAFFLMFIGQREEKLSQCDN